MAEEANSNRSPIGEAIGSIVAVILAILALAHVAPNFLVAIATIAFGAALLLHGATMLDAYARLSIQSGPVTASAVGGGLSSVLLAGAGGIVLGILALLGISTIELTAIASIAFGAALILSCNSALRLHLLRVTFAAPQDPVMRYTGEMLAGEMLSSSAGTYGLAGLAAIVLGILALAGFAPIVLILIALLALGGVNIVNGIDLVGPLVTSLRRA